MSATASKTRGPRVPLVAELPAPEPEPPQRSTVLTPKLDAAVLRVQAQARPLVRNAQGQIQNRTYIYVTLSAVTDEVLPLLVAEQLLWKVFPTALDGRPALRYRMTHIPTGEFDEDIMLTPCDPTMQALGSGITYGRRYALVSYLNLTIDEDDDGIAANTVPVDRYAQAEAAHNAAARQPSAAPQPTAVTPQTSPRRISANQRTKLLIPRAKEAGLSDGEFANVLLGVGGDPPREWRNDDHARETLKKLLDHLPLALKDAALEGIDQARAAKAAGAS